MNGPIYAAMMEKYEREEKLVDKLIRESENNMSGATMSESNLSDTIDLTRKCGDQISEIHNIANEILDKLAVSPGLNDTAVNQPCPDGIIRRSLYFIGENINSLSGLNQKLTTISTLIN